MSRQSSTRILDRFLRYASSPRRIAHTVKILLQASIVRRSPFFDRAWYLHENPDVASEGVDPALHYLACGHAAGKDPGPSFCGAEYLALHEDARRSKLNPLVHYERIGRRRGYRVSYLISEGTEGRAFRRDTPEEQQRSFPRKIAAIRSRAERGERIRALFFVTTASVFPARSLFEAMRRDERFDARIGVVPDVRWQDADPMEGMRQCEEALSKIYSRESFVPVRPEADGNWPDLASEADLVCYAWIYDVAPFPYNPRWAAGRPFLPLYVNYGYPSTTFAPKVFGMANYAYCWKVFLESDMAADVYQAASPIGGVNGEVVGCVKLDRLSTMPRPRKARKCVLLAPHHSVSGGYNDLLRLSNFLRYADDILALPSRYPDLDFLFRPHPFLFPVLERRAFWGPEKCAAWKDAFLANRNARWSVEEDYLLDFAAADAIIQDCASFLAEWMFTERPCCYLLGKPSDREEKFLPMGRECLDQSYLAYRFEDVDRFLQRVVRQGDDEKADSRRALAERLKVNYPHAAEAALDSISSILLPKPRS